MSKSVERRLALQHENLKCFCGCDEFYIQKPNYQWIIVCAACKCRRRITSPGISVRNYEVSAPFVDSECRKITGNTDSKCGT